MTNEELRDLAAKLSAAKLQFEADAAEQQLELAKAHAEGAKFGLSRGKRPSSFMGPLVMFYDDVGSRWAASYGAVSEQIVAMLPHHISETGVTAYGATPEEALLNFDKLWSGESDASPESDI